MGIRSEIRKRKAARAASTIEYSMTVGLIAILGIGAVIVLGGIVRDGFFATADRMAASTDGGDPGPSEISVSLGVANPEPFHAAINEVFSYDFTTIATIEGAPAAAIDELAWRVDESAGSLPSGLSLGADTGVLMGIPTEDGPSSFEVVAAYAGHEGRNEFTLLVHPAPIQISLGASTPAILTANVEQPFTYDFGALATVSGGPIRAPAQLSDLTWSLGTGALPAGLALDPHNGTVSGTPVTQSAEGGDSFELVGTRDGFDELGNREDVVGRRIYTIEVAGVHYDVTQIAAGGQTTCAITAAGGAVCWGINTYGQLGDGTTADRSSPVPVTGLDSGVSQISVSDGGGVCAIVSGAAKCWGRNSSGQLGVGNFTDQHTPQSVSGFGSGVTQISAGENHTCAVKSGAAWCWGSDGSGQLGNTTSGNKSSPTQVDGLLSGVVEISAAGTGHSCAIVGAGAIRCWGENSQGQVGSGDYQAKSTPFPVNSITQNATRIALGQNSSCALVSGGVKCWGNNTNGQLGNGSTTKSNVPVNTQDLTSGVADLMAGMSHTCAIKAGVLSCWGWDGGGQVGAGSIATSRTRPIVVSGLGSVVHAALGSAHSCAVETTGQVKCWGRNTAGQLGDGSTSDRMSPVLIESTAD